LPAHASPQACSSRTVVSRRFAHAITINASPVKICPRCRWARRPDARRPDVSAHPAPDVTKSPTICTAITLTSVIDGKIIA
jgi:hypothetical protein